MAINAHSPSVYTLGASFEITLSYVWGWIWLDQRLHWHHFVGTGFIFVGILAVIFPDISCYIMESVKRLAKKTCCWSWLNRCWQIETKEEADDLIPLTTQDLIH